MAVLFLILRFMAVADWDWNTASAVVDTVDFGGVLGIVFGTLMGDATFTGVLVAWILAIASVDLAWPPAGRSREWRTLLLVAPLGAVMVALVSTFHMWWLLLVVVLVAAVVVGARLTWRTGRSHNVVLAVFRSFTLSSVIAVLALAVLVQTPWMGLERIDTKSRGVIVGYVFDTEPGFIKVLTEEEREFTILTTTDVVSRTLVEN
ncbi:hypothetical protein [Haloactinospora alba]|uniref:hypothetical protein n=1 Tax=Haloactinospora alba TaxID=405555 RepID=UPI00115411E6|nr:hypothetical protein [Haloactinospora alba]